MEEHIVSASPHPEVMTDNRPGKTTSADDDDQARWASAAQVRKERPGWVVIWLARKREFRARPLFRAPADTVAAGATPEELTARMEEIQRAASRLKHPARA
jgi:hypothetical protein